MSSSLRNLTNDFGRLREGLSYEYSGRPFLPFNQRHEIDCRRDHTESQIGCLLAGDVRANEQVYTLLIKKTDFGLSLSFQFHASHLGNLILAAQKCPD